jgi:hypothetical protein
MKRQAKMIRSMCAAVLLLATSPLLAQSLDGVSVTAAVSGTIRPVDPFNNPFAGCSNLAFSMGGAATGAISGAFTAAGTSEASIGSCDLWPAGAEVSMTFQIGGAQPVTGTITYSGSRAVYGQSVGPKHQTVAPGVPALVLNTATNELMPNPPAIYRAVTPAGIEIGAVRFVLSASGPSSPGPATGTFVATFESVDVAFAEMAAKAELNRKRGTFEVKAVFALGEGSDGIDPMAEDVTLTIGAAEMRIPAGSFGATKKSDLKFGGVVDGVAIEARLRLLDDGFYEFKAEGAGLDVGSVEAPVVVGLRVGNDFGSATVKGD